MRKLSNSTPTVINTELRPFDESFRIDANGQLEQWFYDNTSQYVPNRTVTVLTLTPVLSVYDADTDKSYTTASTQGEEDYIAFYYLQWYVNEYNGTTYQETLITSSADGAGVDYFTQGNNLIVKKNVSYAHAVTIRCVATYIDPRDAGITYSVEDSVILSCSRDATVVLPEVAIVSPSARSFNPLVDGYTTENGVEVQNTEYEFEGTVTNSPAVEHVTSSDLAEYKVDGWGTEEIESASGSCAPTLTIRYPDGSIESDARFMYRKTADGTKLDVSGNAFVTNIKGETVAWNQLIYNGNFANGLTAWTNYGTNSTVAVENGKLKIIPGANNQGATYYYNFNTPLGHKMYYDFKVSSPTTGTLLLYKNSNNISGYPLIVGEKRIQSILTVGSGYAGKHINLLFRFPTAGETYYLYGNIPSSNGVDNEWSTYQLKSFSFESDMRYASKSVVLAAGATEGGQDLITSSGTTSGITFSAKKEGDIDSFSLNTSNGYVSDITGNGGAIIVTASQIVDGNVIDSDYYVITVPYASHEWWFWNTENFP